MLINALKERHLIAIPLILLLILILIGIAIWRFESRVVRTYIVEPDESWKPRDSVGMIGAWGEELAFVCDGNADKERNEISIIELETGRPRIQLSGRIHAVKYLPYAREIWFNVDEEGYLASIRKLFSDPDTYWKFDMKSGEYLGKVHLPSSLMELSTDGRYAELLPTVSRNHFDIRTGSFLDSGRPNGDSRFISPTRILLRQAGIWKVFDVELQTFRDFIYSNELSGAYLQHFQSPNALGGIDLYFGSQVFEYVYLQPEDGKGAMVERKQLREWTPEGYRTIPEGVLDLFQRDYFRISFGPEGDPTGPPERISFHREYPHDVRYNYETLPLASDGRYVLHLDHCGRGLGAFVFDMEAGKIVLEFDYDGSDTYSISDGWLLRGGRRQSDNAVAYARIEDICSGKAGFPYMEHGPYRFGPIPPPKP